MTLKAVEDLGRPILYNINKSLQLKAFLLMKPIKAIIYLIFLKTNLFYLKKTFSKIMSTEKSLDGKLENLLAVELLFKFIKP